MTPEELRLHLKGLARNKCQRKHRIVHDSLICVGPGSVQGFGPPCNECLAETEREYEAKRAKAHGRELSPEETAEIKKRLGIE